MTKNKFPPGWDKAHVKTLIAHYDQLDENAQVAEDEAALEAKGQTVMVIPTKLVSAVRELIAKNGGA